MRKLFVLVFILITCLSFRFFIAPGDEPVPVPPSQQRTGGDSAKGYHYLVNGDYIKAGIPENVFRMGIGKPTVYLKRDSVNEGIPHDYTAVKAFNGEIVIAPNCLQCHAQVFEGQLYIGLGNTLIDFSDKEVLNVKNREDGRSKTQKLEERKQG